MDIDLKAFGLIIGTGLAAVGVVYLSLSVSYRRAADRLVGWLRGGSETQVVPVLLGSILLLSAGLTIRDVSGNVLHGRAPHVFANEFLALLPADSADELSILLHPNARCAVPGQASEGLMVRLTPLGSGVEELFAQLNRTSLGTPVEARTFGEVETGLLPGRCVTRHEADLAAREMYYVAKNTDFGSHDIMGELQEFRSRYGFERSVIYELMAGIYLVCILYLVRSMQLMWRDPGLSKTIASCVLAVGATVGAFSMLSVLGLSGGMPGWMVTPYWLPALVIFVIGYRTRRMWKRILWVAMRRPGVAVSVPLIRYEGEWEAARVLMVIGVFVALVLPARAAYNADHLGYLRRVYGYYETIRGAALDCREVTPGFGLLCRSHGSGGAGAAERVPGVMPPGT